MEEITLLEVKNLKTYFYHDEGIVKAIDDISFDINRGETVGIVGESGCGKSITSLSILQLVPQPRGKIVDGRITYYPYSGEKINITAMDPHGDKIRKIRGKEISMIFQEPMVSLHPSFTIGNQIIEALLLHQDIDKGEARERAVKMLRLVGMSAPDKRLDAYPHEMSGGMRQRVMIAMALSCSPKLLIADEPTTALDVTIEAQILELMKDLQQKLNMSIMFISHDLDVIGEMSRKVIVMYAGKIVERAPTRNIFHNPAHPYTRGLLNSLPKIGKKEKLIPIEGSVPQTSNLPAGCYFAPRCPDQMDICLQKQPPMFRINNEQTAKCWLYKGEGEDNNE